MEKKTITDEIIELLNDPGLPAKKDGLPIEHGLVLGLQPNRSNNITCGFYGSLKHIAAGILQVLEKAPEMRSTVFSAVWAYCRKHPGDPTVLDFRAKLDAQAPEAGDECRCGSHR